MAKTPVIVDPDPPEHLSERSKELWRKLIWRARVVSRQTLLQTALEALDRADEARRSVDKEGLTFTTKSTGAIHINPLIKIERESRSQFLSLWTALGFESAEPGPTVFR